MPVEPASQPPTAPSPSALQPLAYDELPPGSDLRREYGPGGAVTITAPAGEPSEATQRAAAQSTAVSSALLATVGLLAVLAVAMPLGRSFRRLDDSLKILTAVVLAVFCGAVFLLIWKVRLAGTLDVVSKARRGAAVIYVDARRVLIESAGPDGERSYELAAGDVLSVSVRAAGGSDGTAIGPDSVPSLELRLADGSVLHFLSGRHAAELRWVAATVAQALGRQQA